MAKKKTAPKVPVATLVARGKKLLQTKRGVQSPTKTQALTESAFHEVKQTPPTILAKTRKKKGKTQANKQRIAIALSKARASGAHIPAP
jgi:hypothetical protein